MDNFLRNSTMGHLARSPLHWKYFQENPIEQTPAMRLGTLFHRFFLQKEMFFTSIIEAAKLDMRTNASKDLVYRANEEGKDVVTADELFLFTEMEKGIFRDVPWIIRELPFCDFEVPLSFIDEDSGVEVRGTADMVGDNYVLDLKTVKDACSPVTRYAVKKYGWNRQGAIYCDGLQRDNFFILAVEKEPPYGALLYPMPHDDIRDGRWEYQDLCKIFKQCQESDTWLGYSGD